MDDRERLIEIINEHRACPKEDGFPCEECIYDSEPSCFVARMADALVENGVTFQPAWISCEERLPIEEGSYIVHTNRGAVHTRHFYTQKHFSSGYTREAKWSGKGGTTVTHWMPLPEPPKGVE